MKTMSSPPRRAEASGPPRDRRHVRLDKVPPRLKLRLRRVRLLLCDVDGVLTDGGVHIGAGVEIKRFDVRDGFGLRLLRRQGIKVGWISHRPSSATRQRAEELRIDFLHQASGSKLAAVEKLLSQTGLTWAEVCYLGDDLVDLAAMKRAGLPVTVPEAPAEPRSAAAYITRARGGGGAVREVAELILKAQGKWTELVAAYTQ